MSAILRDCPPVQAAYEEYKRDPAMRERGKARERFLIDQRLNVNEAREEGEAKKARETATLMKKKGYSDDEIAELAGLSLSEIERLS